jgi:hypothetical protein
MEKDNIFCSSDFHMDTGDVLHILIKDLVGTLPEIDMTGDNDTEDFGSIYFDFLWTGEVDGNYLISDTDGRRIEIIGRDFFGDYIPETSGATFRLQADADFIVDDCTDYLWFNYLTSTQRDVTLTEMISDNYRTLVKYSNTAPFNITAIGLIKDSVILTQAMIDIFSSSFDLWLFWSGVYNDYGYLKDNRNMAIGNAIAIGFGSLTPLLPPDAPTLLTATKFSYTEIDLSWTNPSGSISANKIYISTDNINFTLNDTIAPDVSYRISGLSVGFTYYIYVIATKGVLDSLPSNTATCIIAYDAAASALFTRMIAVGETPIDARKLILDTAIVADKAAIGFTTKYDAMWLLAAHGNDSALLNIVKNAHTITLVNTPDFVVDRGYTGNASDEALNTNYNPSTQGILFTQNAASIGIYIRTHTAGLIQDFSAERYAAYGVWMMSDYGNQNYYGINDGDYGTPACTDVRGMWILTRIDSTHVILYHDGVVFDTRSSTSEAVSNAVLHLMCKNVAGTLSRYSGREYALVFAGGIMTQTNVTDFQTIWVDGYLDSIGAKI